MKLRTGEKLFVVVGILLGRSGRDDCFGENVVAQSLDKKPFASNWRGITCAGKRGNFAGFYYDESLGVGALGLAG